jgi:hypothetical protein
MSLVVFHTLYIQVILYLDTTLHGRMKYKDTHMTWERSMQNMDVLLEYLKRLDSVMLDHICLTDCQASGGVDFVQLQQSRSDPDTSVLHA